MCIVYNLIFKFNKTCTHITTIIKKVKENIIRKNKKQNFIYILNKGIKK